MALFSKIEKNSLKKDFEYKTIEVVAMPYGILVLFDDKDMFKNLVFILYWMRVFFVNIHACLLYIMITRTIPCGIQGLDLYHLLSIFFKNKNKS